jgi:hypothetical protein
MKRLAATALPLAACLGLASAAFGATEEEWAAFRADVEAKCLEAAAPLFETATATVDPFGSPSYGLALIQGPARGATTVQISAICVYDKVTKTVEIGGELPPPGGEPAPPATTPLPMTPATPATPATPNPGQGPAAPATPATPATPAGP